MHQSHKTAERGLKAAYAKGSGNKIFSFVLNSVRGVIGGNSINYAFPQPLNYGLHITHSP